VSDFLVSPSRETEWTISPDEFVERLRARWPEAQVEMADPDSLAALAFTIGFEGSYDLDGRLMSDGQVVGLDGGLEESAHVAAWVRDIVQPEQELVFWDQGYNFHVPLVSGITPQEIVEAVEAAD
jgi:hypothetical protein